MIPLLAVWFYSHYSPMVIINRKLAVDLP